MLAQKRLVGRERECEVLDRVLDTGRLGSGGALAIYGEPGVGKTALIDYAVERAPEFRVAHTAGAEGEMRLPFAALQQLCTPVLDLLGTLPEPQRESLEVALGLRKGRAPNQFLVSLAALSLFSEAAVKQPLLCIVDDAQWLDRESALALAFVARRLLAEQVVVLFAAREALDILAGLPEIRVGPLGHRDSRELLEAALPARLDERVLERIVIETRGNPLALLELPRGLAPAQLAGGFDLPAARPIATGIEKSFTRRLARLPLETRRLLLLAAAEPLGDRAILWRAATQLGITETAVEAAEREGLIALNGAVTFRHPLVRSAVYGNATATERHEVHGALAEATDPQVDPDRRAWHRAQATATPDESIAGELERSAERAQARGGFAAAAAFLDRAAALTPEESRRSARALAAAEAKLQAGAFDDALRLIATAESGTLNDLDRARTGLLRAQLAFLSTRGRDAAPQLLRVAEELRAIDPALARETYLEALTAAIFAGQLAKNGARSHDIAQAAQHAPPAKPLRGLDLLLDGLSTALADSYAAAVPILRATQRALGDGMSQSEELRWMWGGTLSAMLLWDDEAWERLAERHLRLARETGAIAGLPVALGHRGQMYVFAGQLDAAASLDQNIADLNVITGSPLAPYHGVGMVAMRGREDEAKQFIEAARPGVLERGEGAGLSFMDWAEALLYNGLGRYAQALAAARRVLDNAELLPVHFAMPELIEAAVRTGERELAAEVSARLTERATASGTEWALGISARSNALLSEGQQAEDLYTEAIERLARTRVAVDLARAHLVYGEWLRRAKRRVDARAELRTAHKSFEAFGMEAFAERARSELEATGEHVQKRSVDARRQLTPQEAQVARLVAEGRTNREVAAQLFISPSTVEYHLRKVFRKLEVSSRTEMASNFREREMSQPAT